MTRKIFFVFLMLGLCGLVLYLLLKSGADIPNEPSRLGTIALPSPPEEGNTKVSRSELNRLALEKISSGDPVGYSMLFELLVSNKTEGGGVNLEGVDLSKVLKEVWRSESDSNWAEFLNQPSSPDLSRYWSLEDCNLNSSGHPGVYLRGISFGGARADTETWKEWASALDGRGLEGALLSSVDLSGLDLKGISLKFTNLAGTGIRPSFADGLPDKLEGSNLAGVDFANIETEGVTLRYADLKKAFISAEQLVEVARSAGGSGLRGAVLPPVNLKGHNLAGVVLQFADLRGVELTKGQVDQIAASWGGMGLHGATLPPDLKK